MMTTMKMTTMTILSKFIQIYRNCLGTFPAPRPATAHWLVPNYTAWWQRQTCVHTNEKRPTAISWVVFSEIRRTNDCRHGQTCYGPKVSKGVTNCCTPRFPLNYTFRSIGCPQFCYRCTSNHLKFHFLDGRHIRNRLWKGGKKRGWVEKKGKKKGDGKKEYRSRSENHRKYVPEFPARRWDLIGVVVAAK